MPRSLITRHGASRGLSAHAERTAPCILVVLPRTLFSTQGGGGASAGGPALEPLPEGEAAGPVRRSHAERWAANLAAARQYHAREGHLNAPRKHVEVVDGIEHKPGAFLDNTRRRADKLTPERRAELDQLGMRWK